MCEFISWIELDEKVFFLENADLDTKEGRELIKYLGDKVEEDLPGHGAIRHYYPELKEKGINKECTDFSSPKNFPKEIVSAIKQGKLSRIGVCPQVLNKIGNKAYKKVEAPALEAYEKVKAPALEAYKKVEAPALEDYKKVEAPALEAYEKVKAPAWEAYEKVKAHAWEAYKKVEAPAFHKIVRQKQYRNKEWK